MSVFRAGLPARHGILDLSPLAVEKPFYGLGCNGWQWE